MGAKHDSAVVPDITRVRKAVGAAHQFPVWRTIKLGTCKTPYEYHDALRKAYFKIGEWGDDILSKIDCSRQQFDVDLVVLSVKELAPAYACYTGICARGVELGMELCPAEVGPALRLSYKDQPRCEWLHITMEAIRGCDSNYHIFTVAHDPIGPWLCAYDGLLGSVLNADDRFVFVRRKS